MRGARSCRPVRRCAAVAAGLLLAAALWPAAAGAAAPAEVRALWVVRTSLTSPAAIDRLVTAARAGGFNALLVQVRGRGDAYYLHGLEPRPVDLAGDPAFDPLATAIARGHAAGLQVHAWITIDLIASAATLPQARGHLIYRHPEWLMVPRALAADLAPIDPHSPEYLGRLARYVRSRASEIEGLYASPVSDAAADHVVAVVRDIASRYALDGVHLDYARYPDDQFDYSPGALAAFRASLRGRVDAADERRLDRRLAADPLAYTDAFPQRWRAFRADRLTRLIARVRDAVRHARPSARLSVAVSPDPIEAVRRRLQEWPRWLLDDLVDVVCPMAYTTDPEVFAAQIATARRIAGPQRIWAGIGAYRLSAAQIVDHVASARRLDVGGIILFSYDSLTDAPGGTDYLSQVGQALTAPSEP